MRKCRPVKPEIAQPALTAPRQKAEPNEYPQKPLGMSHLPVKPPAQLSAQEAETLDGYHTTLTNPHTDSSLEKYHSETVNEPGEVKAEQEKGSFSSISSATIESN